MNQETVDTSNMFLVGSVGSECDIVFMYRPGPRISRKAAINLAAWLIALTDETEVNKLLTEIKKT